MEVLLMATKWSFQLVLEQLCSSLLSKTLRQLPVLLGFHGEFLVCTVMVILTVKCHHTLRSHNKLAKCTSAATEKHHKVCEKTALMTTATEALESSVVEAGFMTLQTLCLSAVIKHLNSSSLEDIEDLLENEQESKRPKISPHGKMMARLQEQTLSLHKAAQTLQSHMTESKWTLEASQLNGEQLQKDIIYGLKENIHLQENLKVIAQEIVAWKQREQEMKELIKVLEYTNAKKKEVVQDKDRQMKSLAETMLKMVIFSDHLRETYMHDGNTDLDKQRESENREHQVYPSAVDVNKLINIVNLNVSSKRLERKKLETFKKVCKENQMTEEITGHIKSLQNQQACLQSENSHLEKKTEKLQKKLQILSEVHQKHVLQLVRNSVEEGSYCSEIEKKLREAYRNMNFTYQKRNLYKKMAEDMENELDRTNSFFHNQIIYYEKKAQERALKALSTERNINELKKENDYIRELLTKAELKAHVFPRGLLAPDIPTATFRSLKV